VSDLSVALESIRACFAGVFPTQFATCSPDGTPNVIAVSLVHYVDSERVAVSRQFLRKTCDNVEANRKAQLLSPTRRPSPNTGSTLNSSIPKRRDPRSRRRRRTLTLSPRSRG
jgi:hypothetical protein